MEQISKQVLSFTAFSFFWRRPKRMKHIKFTSRASQP